MARQASLWRAARAVLGGLIAFVPLAAAAGDMSDAQRFPDFLRSEPYRTLVTRYFNEEEPGPLRAKCATLSVTSWGDPIVVVPATFTKNGGSYALAAGRWVQPATLNRCGAKALRRTLLSEEGGILHGGALLPGEFPGNLQLETDATHIVLPAAMGIAKCNDWKSLWVLDTKLTKPAAPQGWSETWTMQACGRAMTADVVYTADATGMNITAKNVKVR
ncbi:MAG TPA: hypothetical protein VNU97_19475 [Rhizomicrobium sp.]|jgi:hypothetical protein|nr:hypothetical protein [Rhizomicrobium sp.]